MMGKKDTELQIRQLTHSVSYHHEFSKKKAKETGKSLAKSIIDEGNVNPVEALGNITRLKEVLINAESHLKTSSPIMSAADSKDSYNGVTFSVMNTGDRLDYEKDPIYADLKNQLKDREAKLKQAYKSHQNGGGKIYTEGYDPETGELVTYEVPVVPVKTVGKQTVKIEY